MANLVTNTLCFTGALNDLFDTFKQEIIVNKEPKKTVSNVSTPTLAGYSNRRQEVSYTLTPRSGIFHSIVDYRRNQDITDENGLQLRTPEGEIYIKTSGGAKDYIIQGKTENIIVDNKIYNVTSSYEIKRFLGYDMYVFTLTETN